MLARTPVHGRGARAGSLNPHPLFFFLPSPFLADGVHGGQGRCFLFWQEFLTCMKGDDRVGSITTRSRRARTHTRTRTLEEESRALLSHPAPWLSRANKNQKPKTKEPGKKKTTMPSTLSPPLSVVTPFIPRHVLRLLQSTACAAQHADYAECLHFKKTVRPAPPPSCQPAAVQNKE